MDHFRIPKLELMHSVVPSIRWAGAAIQWSADVTEHAHITEIKRPAEFVNNHNYNPQICRFLDRGEKRRDFELATVIRDQGIDITTHLECGDSQNDEDESSVPMWIDEIETNEALTGPSRQTTNYFTVASSLLSRPVADIVLPLRTFVVSSVAFHLNLQPDIKRITIRELAGMFQLPDLERSLAEYTGSTY